MRVILPPLTNQYLNLTKNSSLAVAIGYPDLFSVFAGTTLSQTGQAIEIIAHHHGRLSRDLAGHQRDHEFLRMADQPEHGRDERDQRHLRFRPRRNSSPSAPAPVKTTGFVGFLRTRLFNSPTNILITIVSALLLWFIVVPAAEIPADRRGLDRQRSHRLSCRRTPDDAVGACWPFIQAKFPQFIYGFYPEPERWRVNLTFVLAAFLLVPLLIPRLPAKGLNAGLFFVAFPVVAFFLLHGGGIGGFGISWTAGFCRASTTASSTAGGKLAAAGEATAVIGPLLWLLGKLIVLLSHDRVLAVCCR